MDALSKAQVKALVSFAQAGGHGFGESSGISKATAKALARRGLVIAGTTARSPGWRRMWVALITQEGLDALKATHPGRYDHLTLSPYLPYRWAPVVVVAPAGE